MHLAFKRLSAFFLILALGFGSSKLSAQLLKVFLEPQPDLMKVTYQAMADEVIIMTLDSFPREVLTLSALEKARLIKKGDSVKLYHDGQFLGTWAGLVFWANDAHPQFSLLLDRNWKPEVSYYDHLEVTAGGRTLNLINYLHLENYVRGVVQAEAGHHKSLEFFKVQAISARTYALNHLQKHKREGYDLCDNTHCQAYKGTVKNNPMIEEAVEQTKGKVIVYGDDDLIEAVFSANCGGFTANSEDVWISPVKYLRATSDYNFCKGSRNHAWHSTLTKLEFLARLGDYLRVQAFSFTIIPDISGRVKSVTLNNNPRLKISGEEIRRLFRFKSGRFRIYHSRNLLFIEGTGFGHGVGMCQDGAYHLSQNGLNHEQIIQHYYQGVEIREVESLPKLWQ